MGEAGRRNSSRLSFAVTAIVVGRGYKAPTTEITFTRSSFAARATTPGRSHSIKHIRSFQVGFLPTPQPCTYAEMAAHYDTAILPARPRRPRDKAKMEVAVLIIERWLLGRL